MVSIVGFDFSRQPAFLLGLIIPALCSVLTCATSRSHHRELQLSEESGVLSVA